MRTRNPVLALLLAAPALAQLPAPTLISRTAPRAAWTAVTSAGLSTGATSGTATVNATFRADNPGVASPTHLYVFGGSLGNNTALTGNDLWAFDAVAGTFTQMIADGAAGSPAQRGRAAMAWNPLTSRIVLFGGNTRGTTPTLLADTWEYDPATNSWTNVTPAGSPTAREHAAMAYDPGTGGMLLFGGNTSATAPAVLSNETWLFIGGSWAQLSPANSPPARSLHSMVTRTDSFQDVLLCGGADSVNAAPEQIRFLDVWRWTGSDWAMLSNWDVITNTGTSFPASSLGNQAVYDPLRQRLVLQGGNGHNIATNTVYLYGTSYGGSPTNFTSEFDSLTNSWTIYANATTGATPFNNTDPVLGRVSRYFGGFVGATGKVYKACGQDPTRTGSRPTYNVYEYQATPVAAAMVAGTGCTGSAGALALAADNLPWSGRTFQATGTGFPAGSLAFGAIGFTASATPLAALHPLGGAGCQLLATPDATLLLLPAAGNVTFPMAVPAGITFAGLPLTLQVLCAEVDLSFNLSLLTSTNALQLTVGAL